MADAVVRLVQPSGDDTGATDPSNISSAITALQTAYSDRETVTVVLAGDYYLDEAVAITGTPGVIIDGVNATVTQKTAATASFAFSSSAYCTVRGVRFLSDSDCNDAVTFNGVTYCATENNLYEANYVARGVSSSGTSTRGNFPDARHDAEIMRKMAWRMAANTRTTYVNTIYSYNANAISAGATEYGLISAYYFYEPDGGDYDRSAVHPGYVAARIIEAAAKYTTTIPAMLNIEEWSIVDKTEQAIANIETALIGWRVASSRPIGLYRIMPRCLDFDVEELDVAQSGGDDEALAAIEAHMRSRMLINDQVANRLRRYVDFIAPRVYVRGQSDMTSWKYDAAWKICEATRIANGLPVRPVVWFCDSSDDAPLSEANWIAMLQYVASFPRVDSLILYSGGTAPSAYTWTDSITALVNGTGDFEDS